MGLYKRIPNKPPRRRHKVWRNRPWPMPPEYGIQWKTRRKEEATSRRLDRLLNRVFGRGKDG